MTIATARTAVPAAATVAFLATTADNFVLFLLLWVAQPQGWSGVQTAMVVLVLRLPTLFSGVLLAISIWMRLKLNESPAYQRMEAEGGERRAPYREAFGTWRNGRFVDAAHALGCAAFP